MMIAELLYAVLYSYEVYRCQAYSMTGFTNYHPCVDVLSRYHGTV